jgi:hypothetical protein
MNDDMSHGLIMRELRSLQLTQSVPGLNDDTPDDGGPLDKFDASRLTEREPFPQADFQLNQGYIGQCTDYEHVIPHVEQELHAEAYQANFIARGHWLQSEEAPTLTEAAQFLAQVKRAGKSAEDVYRHARNARRLRVLLDELRRLADARVDERTGEGELDAERQREAQLRREFEAHEAAEKERRFQEWRDAR